MYTINKKNIEYLIKQSLNKFGKIIASNLLDSLKLLGFYYSTNSGLSLNIEDLKTPLIKENILSNNNWYSILLSHRSKVGFITEETKYNNILTEWDRISDYLKNYIVDYYRKYEPVNNLFIMSSSGARGNMTQVKQLVSMRGLMTDQTGKLIKTPILQNFREGLNQIDYVISAFGARKGIVDTALKTADSGYLTRRLIYLTQDLIIRDKDCYSISGIFLNIKNNNNLVIGKNIVDSYPRFLLNNIYSILKNNINYVNNLENYVNIRSPLTCQSHYSICQKCYGNDFATEKKVSLGHSVGIIAAQSIGEPGTQLTMRTFHTGGVFSGNKINYLKSNVSGYIFFNKNKIKNIKLNYIDKLSLLTWSNKLISITLPNKIKVNINSRTYISKNTILAEYSEMSNLLLNKKLKPIFTNISGLFILQNVIYNKNSFLNNKEILNKNICFWILSGTPYFIPKEMAIFLKKEITSKVPFAFSKISINFSGIIKNYLSNIYLYKKIKNKNTYKYINKKAFYSKFENIKSLFLILTKNYNFFDYYTIIAHFYLFSKLNSVIYITKQKNINFNKILFIISEKDILKINLESLYKKMDINKRESSFIRYGDLINPSLFINISTVSLKKDGFNFILQKSLPILVNSKFFLSIIPNTYVQKNKIIGHYIDYDQKIDDIVQGLPKIEKLFEVSNTEKSNNILKQAAYFVPESLYNKKMIYSYKNLNIIYSFNNYLNNELISINHSYLSKDSIYSLKGIFYCIQNIIKKNILKDKKLFKSYFNLKKNQEKGLLINTLNYSNPKKIFKNITNIYILKKNKKLYIKNNNIYYKFKNLLNTTLVLNKNNYNLNISDIKIGKILDFSKKYIACSYNLNLFLYTLFNYQLYFDNQMESSIKSIHKFQLILLNSIQSIYLSQNVIIGSIHLELAIKQMTSKIILKNTIGKKLCAGELISFNIFKELYILIQSENNFKFFEFDPIVLPMTKNVFYKKGFLAAASFQELKKVLTKASIEGSTDWLLGLKERIITGKSIPAGTSFLNYKNYLDNIFNFKA